MVAEKEGFEPSRQLPHPTPLAGEPLRPLGYFSIWKLAEREGFEPPVPCDITGFQDQRLQPLGHLSLQPARTIIAKDTGNVNREFSPFCRDVQIVNKIAPAQSALQRIRQSKNYTCAVLTAME